MPIRLHLLISILGLTLLVWVLFDSKHSYQIQHLLMTMIGVVLYGYMTMRTLDWAAEPTKQRALLILPRLECSGTINILLFLSLSHVAGYALAMGWFYSPDLGWDQLQQALTYGLLLAIGLLIVVARIAGKVATYNQKVNTVENVLYRFI